MKETFDFSVAGVTMQGRQKTLRAMRNACLKASVLMPGEPKVGDKSPRYLACIRRLKLKLKPDPKNKYDPHAIQVLVWSKNRKKWMCIGYVPKKFRLQFKSKSVPLNKIVCLLISSNRIKRKYLTDLSYFRNESDELVYYCKVTLEIIRGE
jgi:hypothetical protein